MYGYPLRRARRAGRITALSLIGLLLAAGCESPDDPPTPTSGGPTVTRVIGARPVGTAAYPVPAGALFVSPSGDDGASGSSSAPFRTLATAVQRARPGATIVLRAGTYRESVQVYGKALTIQSYPGEEVWLSGSEPVRGWVQDGGAWRKDGWTYSFERTSDGASHLVEPRHPLAAWPEMVFVDGDALRQVASRSALTPGTFYVEDGRNQLFVGTDPTGRTVEATTREWALYLNNAPGSVLRGFGVRHYATSLSRIAAVRAFSDRSVIENLVVQDNAASGLSVVAADVAVRDNTFLRNGLLGLHQHNADGAVVERNLLRHNNVERFDPFQGAGGQKITKSRHLRYRDNHFLDNAGPGLWTDQSSYDVTVTGNLAQRNARSGFQFELSGKVVAADNVATDNGERGIWVLESNDVEVWNNTLLDNVRNLDVLDNYRTISDLSSHNHDRRFPVPNTAVPWDVRRVNLRNNVLGDDTTTAATLFRVDDVTRARSAASMGVSSDYNAFYRRSASAPAHFALWSHWPSRMHIATNLATHRSGSGQDLHSVSRDGGPNPWVTDPASGDYRVPASAPGRAGAPLSAPVAAALGLDPGTPVPIGAL